MPILQDCSRTGGTDGIKLYVMWKGLLLRRSHEDLFREGEYLPLRVTGARENHIVAFARRFRDQWCVVAVPTIDDSPDPSRNSAAGAQGLARYDRRASDGGSVAMEKCSDRRDGFPTAAASSIFTTLPFALLTTSPSNLEFMN